MADLQYAITKVFERILDKKFKSPCHISDEEKALAIDMVGNPIPFISNGQNWVNLLPKNNWTDFVVRKTTTEQTKQDAIKLVSNPFYVRVSQSYSRYLAVQIDAECNAYRRFNTIFDPIDPQTDDIEFTEQGILSVKINQLLPELRTQVRPAFLAWKNAQLRIVALNQRLWLNEDDLAQLKTWSEDFDRLKNSGDIDTLISLYGATCIPKGARKRDGTLYQGALFETGTESNPENIFGAVGEGSAYSQYEKANQSDLCQVNNLPPYFARPQRENIYSGTQDQFRSYQRDVAGDRRRFWDVEIKSLESQISKLKNTTIPQAENAERIALVKWKEVQQIVLKYVAKQVELQVQSAEAQTQAQRIEAQRQIELAKQKTLQELTQINASLNLSRQRNLMILGASAVGLAGIAILTRGGQMNNLGKILFSAGLVGGAIYGYSRYKKYEDAAILEIEGQTTSNTISTQQANQKILAGKIVSDQMLESTQNIRVKVDIDPSKIDFGFPKSSPAKSKVGNFVFNIPAIEKKEIASKSQSNLDFGNKIQEALQQMNDFSSFNGLPMGSV